MVIICVIRNAGQTPKSFFKPWPTTIRSLINSATSFCTSVKLSALRKSELRMPDHCVLVKKKGQPGNNILLPKRGTVQLGSSPNSTSQKITLSGLKNSLSYGCTSPPRSKITPPSHKITGLQRSKGYVPKVSNPFGGSYDFVINYVSKRVDERYPGQNAVYTIWSNAHHLTIQTNHFRYFL